MAYSPGVGRVIQLQELSGQEQIEIEHNNTLDITDIVCAKSSIKLLLKNRTVVVPYVKKLLMGLRTLITTTRAARIKPQPVGSVCVGYFVVDATYS